MKNQKTMDNTGLALKYFFTKLLLLLVAIFLTFLLFPFAFLVAIIEGMVKNNVKNWLLKISNYFFNLALSIDQFGNVLCAPLFNLVLIKHKRIWQFESLLLVSYEFGNPDETISSVLGRNKLKNNLTYIGKTLAKILNLIEKDHVEKAIELTDYGCQH